jgi:hypothetical protein
MSAISTFLKTSEPRAPSCVYPMDHEGHDREGRFSPTNAEANDDCWLQSSGSLDIRGGTGRPLPAFVTPDFEGKALAGQVSNLAFFVGETVSVHWCGGTAQCPVEAEVRDRHPYAPLDDCARGRAAQAAACKAAEAGSTPAGHSERYPGRPVEWSPRSHRGDQGFKSLPGY